MFVTVIQLLLHLPFSLAVSEDHGDKEDCELPSNCPKRKHSHSHMPGVYKFFLRFGTPQSPGIKIISTLLQSVVLIPMNDCCGVSPKEADPWMEISLQKGY